MKSPGAYVHDLSLTWPCLHGPAFFRKALLLSDGLQPLEGWDAVGVNCKRGATTENQGTGAWYMAKGCMFDDCVSIICLDMTTPP